ncbi:MAG TPA: hypothetical protein PLA01_10055 [Acetivibrio sp.]|nr:hypothetical protein [Acetivibrio sp.]
MNDDFNKKLKQITEMLGGNEKASENLAGLLSLLADSGSKPQSTAASADTKVQKVKAESNTDSTESVPKLKVKDEETGRNNFQDNAEMMRTVKVIMDRMQNMNDPRINLLTAIRPFLNNNRQKKLGNCIRLFQMTQLTKFMADSENTM